VACTGWDLSSVIREAGFNPQAVFLALAALLYISSALVFVTLSFFMEDLF
jgi:hypothetical protein